MKTQNTQSNLTKRDGERVMPRDLVDLWQFHTGQAKHFEPFGARNALTLYHRECARILVEAQRKLADAA
jgi:hypothetical protein